jgi:hypothetical protein
MITPQLLSALQNKGQEDVRRHVRAMLEATPSYGALEAPERRSTANALVKVLSALTTDPDRRRATAGPLEIQKQGIQGTGARNDLQGRLADAPGQVGKGFKAGAVREGTKSFKDLVQAVDFPKFVSSLIEGVFTSIVNSSIKQMHEFGKFLNAVVMSLKDFAFENVNIDEGRDYLASKYPNALEVDGAGGKKRLKKKSDADDDTLPDFKSLFGMQDDVDLDDEESEAKIAAEAQLQLARTRQQQLATMVLLGINRIVVTEGEIKATVQFDVTASDTAKRTATAGTSDTQTHTDWGHEYEYQRKRSFWGTEGSGSGSSSSEVNTRVSTATSNIQDDSESKAEAKAKMTGYVQVKFKSETFPLERMASQVEMQGIQEKSAR